MTTNSMPINSPIASGPVNRLALLLESLYEGVYSRYTRLEIAFWGFAIPFLRKSAWLQSVLAFLYPGARRFKWVTRLPPPAIWMISGLGLGLLIGFLGGVVIP
jgi:hypothetical protein